jgi:DMSO/TMAO reductase YedYZ molybdopterin-dependent catalytic subunit
VSQKRRSLVDLYRRGVLATLPALLVSSAVSVLLNRPWALEPIADRVMMMTPVDLAQQLILHLGVYARPLALFGSVAFAIAIGGCASVLAGDLVWPLPVDEPKRAQAPSAAARASDAVSLVALSNGALDSVGPRQRATSLRLALALCFLLLVTCALFRPLDLLPTLTFIGLYLLTLAVMPRVRSSGMRGVRAAHGAPARRTSGRGAFLFDSACILGATAALVALLLVEPWYRGTFAGRPRGRLFVFRVPPQRRPGFALAGLTPEVTPPDSFYYLSKNLVDPLLSADGWTLHVDGLVARPLTLRFADMLALPARSLWVTQECVSNPVGGPLVSCGLFTGVSVRRLLLRAGPLAAARTLVMRAPDGHADSIPLSLAMNPDVLLAYGLDGTYLTRAHGFPARMLIPGSYGFKSVKWVTQLELVDRQFKGTWQELGWTADAIVQTTTRIDLWRRVGDGLLVAGIAFAGARGIHAVQVRAGDGPWTTALLHTPPLSPLSWVQWRITLPLRSQTPHSIALEARAIDGRGTLQAARQRDIYPAGASGYHRVTATV